MNEVVMLNQYMMDWFHWLICVELSLYFYFFQNKECTKNRPYILQFSLSILKLPSADRQDCGVYGTLRQERNDSTVCTQAQLTSPRSSMTHLWNMINFCLCFVGEMLPDTNCRLIFGSLGLFSIKWFKICKVFSDTTVTSPIEPKAWV